MESLVNFDRLFLTSPEPEGRMRSRAQGNSWEVVWDTYMNTFDKYDSRITNAWKEDAGGLLVFTGLFSAIVGAFIIESYKKLSPDSGDQTVVLLGQISQQLAGFTNVTQPNPSGNQNASTAIILVNAMWLISLVLSITSALFATLLQQWARRYIQTPQVPTSKSQRAHVRSFLFLGIQQNKMPLAVETVPTLLHISVFLFFAGLVIFFFTIHKGVAIAVSISVGLFAVIYVTLTVLPYFDDKCPYRTPMSDLCWYPWHAFLSFQAYFRHLVMTGLHSCIIPPNPGQDPNMPSIQLRLVNQLVKRENALKNHWNRLKDGCEKSIIQEALRAPIDVDQDALTRLFSQLALTDKRGLLNLVASIPSDEIVHIITPPIKSGKMVFREPLTIIRNHVVDMGAGLDKDKYKSCLLVWLSAIHHITKAFFINFIPNRDPETRSQLESLLDDIRIYFADIGRMRAMWAHSDTSISVISRSICALLAKCILQKQGPSDAEIRWLSSVTEVSGYTIYTSLDDPDTLDHMILKSFVCSVFPYREGDITNQAGDISHPEVHHDAANQAGDLPAHPGDIPHQAGDSPTALLFSVAETLAILVDARTKHIFRERILELIGRMQVGDRHEVFAANKLSQMLETPAPELTPSPAPELPPASAPETSPSPPAVVATVPSPAPASPANAFPVRSLFRTIFGVRGRVHESGPERPTEPEP